VSTLLVDEDNISMKFAMLWKTTMTSRTAELHMIIKELCAREYSIGLLDNGLVAILVASYDEPPRTNIESSEVCLH